MKKLLLLLLLTACGSPGPNSIDPVFVPYYNVFVAEAAAHGITIPINSGLTIKFQEINDTNALGEVVAECTAVGYHDGTILVDGRAWESSLAPEQQLIVAHESFHCLLDEQHVTGVNDIMNALINNSLPYFEDPTQQPAMWDRAFAAKGNAG